MLMASVVLGLGMSVTSCKDDDDDKKSEEQKEQEAQEAQQQADAFWAVVGQLTSIDNYTIDYQNKTFEPTIGEPLEGNSTVRVVATNDMASAAERFANLVGASIDANTSNYTYTNDNVGTLTYTKTDNGQSWATVDVNIKQLPKLQQIIYRSPEQGGTNASTTGTCFYRFGDVVQKKYTDYMDDGSSSIVTEYWVCVRPAFNPEGKGDSHWITVSPPPSKHVHFYTDSKKREHALPTGIGTNKEQMQNLAEMLYAIFHPTEWQTNVETYPAPGIFSSGLRMFHDFDHGKVKYHSAQFWQRVREAWDDKGICNKLFGYSSEDMSASLESNGLNLLAKGYSWWTSVSWNLSLYQYTYKNGEGFKSNMHDASGETEIKKNMENITPINVFALYTVNAPFVTNRDFFGDNAPRFVIRHATGKELAGGSQPTVYTTLSTPDNGITDFYTYNVYYDQPVNNNAKPESFEFEAPKVGQFVGKDGKFYNSKEDAESSGTTAVAVVVYYDKTKTVDACGYHGLAIRLNSEGYFGMDANSETCMIQAGSCADAMKDLNGIASTTKITTGLCGVDHSHSGWEVNMNDKIQNEDFSKWFIPSAGQWILALEGMGVKFSSEKNNIGSFSGNFQNISKYLPKGTLKGMCMSSTQQSVNENWVFNLKEGEEISMRPWNNTYLTYYIPFVAFDKTGNTDKGFDDTKKTKKGTIVGDNGKFYNTIDDALNSDITPVAVVVYVADEAGQIEKDESYTRLALSFTRKEGKWAEKIGVQCTEDYTKKENLEKTIDGIARTMIIWNGCNHCNEAHPAAEFCHQMKQLDNNVFSPWFMPSSGQMVLFMKNTSFKYTSVDDMGGSIPSSYFFKDLSIRGASLAPGKYWTSTESDNRDCAWVLKVDQYDGIKIVEVSKTNSDNCYVRPMIAF